MVRVDAKIKAEGCAQFCDDINFNNMVYAALVLSTKAHCKLKFLNKQKALNLAGVLAVLDANDIPGKNQVGLVLSDQPLMAFDKVRFCGEVVGLVLAKTRSLALEAARLVEVVYGEELGSVLDLEEAIEYYNKKLKKNFVIHKENDVICERIIDYNTNLNLACENNLSEVGVTIQTYMQDHAYLEPQSMISYIKDGVVYVYGSMQCPFYVRDAVATVLGVPASKVVVEQTFTGGGFGGKEDVPSEYASLAALGSWYLQGKPVKLVLPRVVDLIRTSKRHSMKVHTKLFYEKASKKLISGKSFIYTDAGAYTTLTTITMFRSVVQALGPYNYKKAFVKNVGLYTNKVPAGAYRGFGSLPVVLAQEIALDIIAKKENINPITLREINMLKKGDKTITGQEVDTDAFVEVLKTSKKEYNRLNELKSELQSKDKYNFYGIGFASSFYGVSLGADGWCIDKSSAIVKLNSDLTVEVNIGASEMGQGVLSVCANLVQKLLGSRFNCINVHLANTSKIPDSGPTVASRSTVCTGNAVIDAVYDLVCKILNTVLKENFSKNDFILKNGKILLKTNNEQYNFRDLAYKALSLAPDFIGYGFFRTPKRQVDYKGQGDAYFTYDFFADLVLLRINKLTYCVEPLEVVAVHDIGVPIDINLAQGQVQGGIVQGLGYVLYENLTFDKNGCVQQTNFDKYIIPTAADIPKIKVIFIESYFEKGPFGAKGLGETPIIAIAPAVVNAIADAINVRFYKLPILPENICSALR